MKVDSSQNNRKTQINGKITSGTMAETERLMPSGGSQKKKNIIYGQSDPGYDSGLFRVYPVRISHSRVECAPGVLIVLQV